jgi:hypothetical protein
MPARWSRRKPGSGCPVPLTLFNASPSGRPLWVKRIAKTNSKGEQLLDVKWDNLDANTGRGFTLNTSRLSDGGTYSLSILLVLATRHKAVEEEYAFSADIALRVASSVSGPSTLKVSVRGASKGTGAGHNVINKIGGDLWGDESVPAGLANQEVVRLERAEKYDWNKASGDIAREGLRVLRHVEFSFSGFRTDDTPRPGNALVPRGRLLFGRNSRKPDATANGSPNDICLRAFDAQGATVDEPATMAISRHHFEFAVINDRFVSAGEVRERGCR